jgi:hypothetical protein
VSARGLFVARRPPAAAHFARQRVRQAYDDLAQPARLAAELALLPAVLWGLQQPGRLVWMAALTWTAAAVGRHRDGGSKVFPFTSVLWAPCWVAERAVCVWLAVGLRLAGGVRYGGTRIVAAATPVSVLRSRYVLLRYQQAGPAAFHPHGIRATAGKGERAHA